MCHLLIIHLNTIKTSFSKKMKKIVIITVEIIIIICNNLFKCHNKLNNKMNNYNNNHNHNHNQVIYKIKHKKKKLFENNFMKL